MYVYMYVCIFDARTSSLIQTSAANSPVGSNKNNNGGVSFTRDAPLELTICTTMSMNGNVLREPLRDRYCKAIAARWVHWSKTPQICSGLRVFA